jgi:hypothetical protein
MNAGARAAEGVRRRDSARDSRAPRGRSGEATHLGDTAPHVRVTTETCRAHVIRVERAERILLFTRT